MNDLSAVLRDATDHVRADPSAAHRAWREAERRSRRTTVLAGAGAAASVLLVAGLAFLLPGRDDGPSPAPAPTAPGQTASTPPEAVDEPRIDGTYDPADWEELPPYPQDLGHWLSPDRPRPLAEAPVDRATVAVSYVLDPGTANLLVIGSDGGWRSVDVTGLTFTSNAEYEIGLSRRSLSPDGTRIALGQPDGVVVVDLTTAERTTYPVDGLGEAWTGRTTSWTADGSAVLLARSWAATSDPDDLAYQPGFRIELATGAVSRLDYDPDHAAQLGDGTVAADLWREDWGHRVVAFGPHGSKTEWDTARRYLGAPDTFSGSGSRWAVRREAMVDPDLVGGHSGFLAFDRDAPLAMLPVAGVELNGGGGQVLGWLDGSTLLFSMPGPEPKHRSVAWDVESGQLWRGPEILDNSRISVPGH